MPVAMKVALVYGGVFLVSILSISITIAIIVRIVRFLIGGGKKK